MNASRWERYPNRVSARRAAAWALHPDRGGDAAALSAALSEIDAHFAVPPPVVIVHARSRPVRALRSIARGVAARRPGRRRYIRL